MEIHFCFALLVVVVVVVSLEVIWRGGWEAEKVEEREEWSFSSQRAREEECAKRKEENKDFDWVNSCRRSE